MRKKRISEEGPQAAHNRDLRPSEVQSITKYGTMGFRKGRKRSERRWRCNNEHVPPADVRPVVQRSPATASIGSCTTARPRSPTHHQHFHPTPGLPGGRQPRIHHEATPLAKARRAWGSSPVFATPPGGVPEDCFNHEVPAILSLRLCTVGRSDDPSNAHGRETPLED